MKGKLIYLHKTLSASIEIMPVARQAVSIACCARSPMLPSLTSITMQLFATFLPRMIISHVWSWINRHCSCYAEYWEELYGSQQEKGVCDVHFSTVYEIMTTTASLQEHTCNGQGSYEAVDSSCMRPLR